jgi:N-methylhydantoinase A
VHFGSERPVATPVFHRHDLAPDAAVQGPAIVEEKTSTLVLYPGQAARVDEYLNIEIVAADGSA